MTESGLTDLSKLADPLGAILNDIVAMLEQLSLSLPKFESYANALPEDENLEEALVEVYTEVICFCAQTISFFQMRRFHGEYLRLNSRISLRS
jgi:hypothetical protein